MSAKDKGERGRQKKDEEEEKDGYDESPEKRQGKMDEIKEAMRRILNGLARSENDASAESRLQITIERHE